ncbi:MAG: leucine-rich repeat domain-containing protein [Clostridia bacterium]|nr:leucine-rich repeat domain-containing protein [Clostridia bacterium]
MKKKLLLTTIFVAVLVLAFAASAYASVVYKDTNGNTLFTATDEDGNKIFESYEGGFPTTDENGVALTWYITKTETVNEDTVHTVDSYFTVDTTGMHATLSENGVYKYVNQEMELSIVSAYFPDNSNILTLDMSDSGYGNTYSYESSQDNILFLRLPNTLVELPFRVGQASKMLECVISDDSPMTSFSTVSFYDAKNLRSVNVPSNVTVLESNGSSSSGCTFFNCKSLVEITFSQNSKLQTIKGGAFNGCSALKEINIPNSVNTIEANAFWECSSLETIRLGANLGKNLTQYNVQSMLYGCKSLKYVYIPSTLVPTSGSHLFFSGATKMVFFYTGTLEQYNSLYETLSTLGNNGKFTSAVPIQWDATKDEQYYKDLAENDSKSYVVYGYNLCEAFYDGKHEFKNEITATFEDEKFLSECSFGDTCNTCEALKVIEVLPALIVDRGYAYGSNAMAQGIAIKKELIEAYAKYFDGIKFGAYAALYQADGKVINADGTGINGYVAVSDYTNRGYDLLDMTIYGITEAYQDTDFCFGAYIIADGEVYYINNAEATDSAVAVSYNDVVAIVDAIPSQKEEEVA